MNYCSKNQAIKCNFQYPARENPLCCVHLQGTKIFLAARNLRYESAASLSERSEFDKPAHAFSRFQAA